MRERLSLAGRVAVITGGAGLLGARFAAALADAGAAVAVADLDEAAARRVAGGLPSRRKPLARGYKLSLPKPASVRRLERRVARELGPVDILINNAATKTPGFFRPFESYALEDWNAVMDVNLTGAMVCCQVFGGAMAQRGRGSILNIASIYGVVGADQRIYEKSEHLGRPINTPAVYAASKAGLLGLTRHLAAYWGHRGVRVNAVTPGGVFSGQNEEFTRRYCQRVPLGRMARADELTGAILFLAGDA
ncbi:MAG: SDR family oxidoreductase, partial [Elusimicrobia bacterium]|nr:SDR family oxidoreductase [Elusimicrobiota bacterium]